MKKYLSTGLFLVTGSLIVILSTLWFLYSHQVDSVRVVHSNKSMSSHSLPAISALHEMRYGIVRVVASTNEYLVVSTTRETGKDISSSIADEEEELALGVEAFNTAFQFYRTHVPEADGPGRSGHMKNQQYEKALPEIESAFSELLETSTKLLNSAREVINPKVIAEFKDVFEGQERKALVILESILTAEVRQGNMMAAEAQLAVTQMNDHSLMFGLIIISALVIYSVYSLRAYLAEGKMRRQSDQLSRNLLDMAESLEWANEELTDHKANLEKRVRERTKELDRKSNELEEALLNEQKMSEQHREFVFMVSHEFRTPLAIIDGAAQRVMRSGDKMTPEKLFGRGEKIRRAITRMIKMIDTMLYSSKFNAGKVELYTQPCEFHELINTICRHQSEISPNHDVQIDIQRLPSSITADPSLLEHIFSN